MAPDKEVRENEVIDSFLAWLASHAQRPLLLEKPDRLITSKRRFPSLTVDALMELKGQPTRPYLACDVMALANDHQDVQYGTIVEDDLQPLAEQHGVQIRLVGRASDKRAAKALVAAIRDEVIGGASGELDFGDTHVQWAPGAPVGAYWAALGQGNESPRISDQMQATLALSLPSKAQKQAKAAHDLGLTSVVLLDSVGHAGIAQGTHWLSTWWVTTQNAVQAVLADLDEHYLDAVMLLQRDGSWHQVYGQPLV